jgi:hypothetical protein
VLRAIAIVCAAVALSGCAAAGLWRVDSAGSSVQSVKALQAVDLPSALNPQQIQPTGALKTCLDANGSGAACRGIVSSAGGPDIAHFVGLKGQASKDRDGATVERLRLEWALQAFYRTDAALYGTPEDRRNRLQSRLIAASDTNCAIFAENLYGVQATGNAILGTTATALGGAGAIVTHVDTARLLSGLAGITTGTRAELNQDYFRNLWVEALLKAIETDRDQRRSDMTAKWGETVSSYPVETAIADAIRYNSACSLVSGLKQVNEAVVIASDPVGLKTFRDVYSRAGFDATFNLNVSSDGKNDRVLNPPGGPAEAYTAAQQIISELAIARVAQGEAIKQIDLHANEANKSAAKQQINDAMTQMAGADPKNPSGPLKNYLDQLTTLQTTYGGLTTDLKSVTTDQQRTALIAQMRANDASADVVRRAALELIHATSAQMADIVRQATQTPPSPTAPAAAPKPPAAAPKPPGA